VPATPANTITPRRREIKNYQVGGLINLPYVALALGPDRPEEGLRRRSDRHLHLRHTVLLAALVAEHLRTHGGPAAIIIGFSIIWSSYGSVLGTLFAESFTADVRYTGISLGYQVGAAIIGGPAPLIATALLAAYNKNYVPVGIFLMVVAVVSLIAIYFAQERRGADLDA
jgi:hypothetical protein